MLKGAYTDFWKYHPVCATLAHVGIVLIGMGAIAKVLTILILMGLIFEFFAMDRMLAEMNNEPSDPDIE